MLLHYRTGLATLIQFITLSLLGIANGLDSVITTCGNNRNNCVSNLLVSTVFFLLTVGWFAGIWLVGYAAQDRRSRKLALILIAMELVVLLVATFNARHHTNLISFITSVTDALLAVWVILVAWRLRRAKGGRIVTSERARQRRNPPTAL
ncbi:hypothetical protein H7Y63_02455 [Polaromonas sp.]|nr:hypothetical protein [Candidatus Saccharibacteria bacterium]